MSHTITSETLDLVRTKQMTSAGIEYQIGQPKDNVEESKGVPESHGASFNKKVELVPGGGWENTERNFALLSGITRWKIEVGGWIWKYKLVFDTNQTFNYTFTDGTGQGYGNNCYKAGIHEIDYNSDNPTIVQASGI